MDRRHTIQTLKENLFILKDADSVTLSRAQIKSLSSSMDAAIKLLEKDFIETTTYPDNLLIDLGYVYDEKYGLLLLRLLEEAMKELKYTDRLFLLRKYRDGKSVDVIAQENEITENSAQDTLRSATTDLSKILTTMINRKGLTSDKGKVTSSEKRKTIKKKKTKSPNMAAIIEGDIALLGLSPRSTNALKRAGYMKTKDLMKLNLEQLKAIKGLGGLSWSEIIKKAAAIGIEFK